ncbi:hypothetical protein NE695_17875, partial [Neglectibacter timonensis]
TMDSFFSGVQLHFTIDLLNLLCQITVLRLKKQYKLRKNRKTDIDKCQRSKKANFYLLFSVR